MRIWYQSSSNLEGIDTFKDYIASIIERSNIMNPDSTIEVRGLSKGLSAIEYRYIDYLSKKEIIENIINAEHLGYDGVVLGCTLDPGLHEARGVVDIPISSLGEASMLFSCTIGKKFSIITYNSKLIPYYEENISFYGLQSRLASIATMKISFSELIESFKNPNKLIDSFLHTAKNAINEGAEVIIPGCGILNQILVKNKISTIKHMGVPIMDTVGLAFIMLSAMLKYKMTIGTLTSRRLFYDKPSKDILREIEKLD